jgi:hypothetical protein
MCPHTTMCPHPNVCVLILLCMCPHTTLLLYILRQTNSHRPPKRSKRSGVSGRREALGGGGGGGSLSGLRIGRGAPRRSARTMRAIRALGLQLLYLCVFLFSSSGVLVSCCFFCHLKKKRFACALLVHCLYFTCALLALLVICLCIACVFFRGAGGRVSHVRLKCM